MNSTKKPFKLKKTEFENQNSFWLDYQASEKNQEVIDASDYNFNVEKIADKILSEFIHTDSETKRQFRPMIIEWLKKNELEYKNEENQYELRDLIYEMF